MTCNGKVRATTMPLTLLPYTMLPLTTSLVSSTFSAEPMGPEQHRHCRSEHNKKIIISWNQRNRFRCISLWDRICETHQNEYAWISLPWVIVVIVIPYLLKSPVFFQEVSMSMYRGMAPSYAPWRPWCHPKPLGFWKAAWKAPAAKALGDSGSNGCHCLMTQQIYPCHDAFFYQENMDCC